MTKQLTRTVSCLVAIIWAMAAPAPGGPRAALPAHTEEFVRGWQAYEAGRYDEARRIWESLAEQGDVNAQVNLGSLYDDGLGAAQDPATAASWYQTAALQGSSAAQFNLGLMYAMGRGVAKDLAQAAEWYRKAAEQGLAIAQYELGMYFAQDKSSGGTDGRAVAANQEVAVEWLYKSGLSYLEEGNTDGAQKAVEAIERLAPGHEFQTQLAERIQTSVAATPSEPVTDDGAGCETSVGTAWPIASGYVITNNHVVADKTDLILLDSSGQEIRAWAVLRDEINDVAVLEVDDADRLPPALPLAPSPAGLGASVFTIGFPRVDVMGTSPKLSNGVISGTKGLRDDPDTYQTTVPIQPGNSGGPLLNMSGEVVGLVTSMVGLRDEAAGSLQVLPNASCALKVDGVKELLPLLPRQAASLAALPSNPDNLETLASRVQKSVLMIVAN